MAGSTGQGWRLYVAVNRLRLNQVASAKRLVQLCGDLSQPVATPPARSGAPVPLHAPLQVEDEVPAAGVGISELLRSPMDSQFRNLVQRFGFQDLTPGICIRHTRCAEAFLVRAQPRLDSEARCH